MLKTAIRTFALVLALGAGSNAFAAGDPKAGAAIAAHWCSGCHAGSAESSASDAAPSLQHLATAHAGQASWLRTWLAAPHPPMPNLNLSRVEIDNIIAYLQQLAATPQ